MIFGRKKKPDTFRTVRNKQMEPFQKGAIDPGAPPTAWNNIEEQLTRHIERLASTPEAIVILEMPQHGHYLQWVHEQGGSVYSEASATLPKERYERLVSLGWKPPFAIEQKHVPNWRQGWMPPFHAGAVARIAIHTLDQVYEVGPSDIRIDQIA